MNFIDTHAHLYREYYPENLEEVVQRAVNQNVTQILLPCVTSSNVQEIYAAAAQFPNHLFPMIGLHPSDVNATYRDELAALETHLSDSQIVAIGEVGMDLYHDTTFVNEQRDALRTQLSWAVECHLPLSVHIRNAYPETLEVLNNFKNCGLKGVLHCFSGGIEEAKWAIKFGLKIGVGGIVTFKKNKLQELIREIGLHHLVLETDAPFLAPDPHRGTTNESAYIPIIAAKVAAVFDTTIDEVMKVTTENAWEIFPKIKPKNL